MRISLVVVLLLVPATALAEEVPSDVMEWARGVIKTRLAEAERAPEFEAGREWLNVSEPLTLHGDLLGKVVILDFWTYCCINCIHVLPDLEYLEEKYAGKAVAVVGVHSAKFTNEKDAENIREAIRRYEIKHPVVNDADFKIWRSYGARAWPTFAVITPDGKLLGTLSGEGNRVDLDALIAACLEHYGRIEGALDAKPLPLKPESASRPSGALAYPGKVAATEGGKRLWIADSNHNRVLEVGADGRFLRAFGDGARGLEDGTGTKARFFRPQGLTVYDGAVWVCDTQNHALRRIDVATGAVATVAGTGKQGNHRRLFRLKGRGPYAGKTTELSSPWDILFVGDTGYIAMAGSHTLWTINPKTMAVAHFAGDGTERRLDHADRLKAAFAQPSGLTWDGRHLYVADSESSAVVRMRLDGGVETVAGGSEKPKDLFHFGDEDGKGLGRRFQHPLHVLWHNDTLYVADSYNHKIKTLDRKTREVVQYKGVGGHGLTNVFRGEQFAEPGGLAAHGRTLYVADTNNHVIRTIDLEKSLVRSLKLTGVPIPQSHAKAGGMGGEWPELPDTVYNTPVQAPVRAGAKVPVTITLRLPDGWKLTEGAPSAMRVRIGAKSANVAVSTLNPSVALPALTPGRHDVHVRVLYYVCQDDGDCRVRSVYWKLDVTASEAGPVSTALSDTFAP